MLHLTNGGNAAGVLVETGLPGEVIPWRDILHVGPVPTTSAEELRAARARFLAACGWGRENVIRATLTMRDLIMDDLADQDEVVLWFEHDLCDQLQLLQALDRLALPASGGLTVSLVPLEPPPDAAVVLSELEPKDFVELFSTRVPVTSSMFAEALVAWGSFRAPDPFALVGLVRAGTAHLPHVAPAIARFLEEYPDTSAGLARVERAVLETLDGASTSFSALFRQVNARESRPFLGNPTLALVLSEMERAAHPLLVGRAAAEQTPDVPDSWNRSYAITGTGRAVLEGRADAIRLNGVDRWLGGVHLVGPDAEYRWNVAEQAIERREER